MEQGHKTNPYDSIRPSNRKDHYCVKPQTVDEYIEAQEEQVRPVLREVRAILQSALPEAEERISWSMPTYWKGRNLIHFAASKKHLGLYPGGEAAEIFAKELAEYDTSKGTIRLPYGEPLPAGLIRRIAEWCFEKYAKGGSGGEGNEGTPDQGPEAPTEDRA